MNKFSRPQSVLDLAVAWRAIRIEALGYTLAFAYGFWLDGSDLAWAGMLGGLVAVVFGGAGWLLSFLGLGLLGERSAFPVLRWGFLSALRLIALVFLADLFFNSEEILKLDAAALAATFATAAGFLTYILAWSAKFASRQNCAERSAYDGLAYFALCIWDLLWVYCAIPLISYEEESGYVFGVWMVITAIAVPIMFIIHALSTVALIALPRPFTQSSWWVVSLIRNGVLFAFPLMTMSWLGSPSTVITWAFLGFLGSTMLYWRVWSRGEGRVTRERVLTSLN